MARPLRIEYEGAVYHVTSRGNARSDIYFSDDDRQMFLDVLEHVIDRNKSGASEIRRPFVPDG